MRFYAILNSFNAVLLHFDDISKVFVRGVGVGLE